MHTASIYRGIRGGLGHLDPRPRLTEEICNLHSRSKWVRNRDDGGRVTMGPA